MGGRYILPTTRVTLKWIPGVSGLWSSPKSMCVFQGLTGELRTHCFRQFFSFFNSITKSNVFSSHWHTYWFFQCAKHCTWPWGVWRWRKQVPVFEDTNLHEKQACKQQREETEVLKWRQRCDGKWCRWRGTNSVLGSTEVWGDSLCEEQSLWLFNIIQHLPRVNHCAVHL